MCANSIRSKKQYSDPPDTSELLSSKEINIVQQVCGAFLYYAIAIDNINNSQLDELVVANSIPLSDEAKKCTKIRTLQLGKLLGESVRRISNEESISAMFD